MVRCQVNVTSQTALVHVEKASKAIIVILVIEAPPVTYRIVHHAVNAMMTGLKY